MASRESPPSLLLALPEPCLLEVLRCCAAVDHRSLFSAARAHSRLHQAAVLALRSITAIISQQQQVDGVLLYLGKHGQHVGSIQVEGPDDCTLTLRQLPHSLQLESLQLEQLCVQLQPGDAHFEGVLGAAATIAALKQLCITGCKLPYGNDGTAEGLAAALSLLPAGLEHLSVNYLVTMGDEGVEFPTGVLQQLQQLTYLELAYMWLLGPDREQPALQPLQALTRLADLRILSVDADDDSVMAQDSTVKITASMLSGMHSLTCLQLAVVVEVDPGALAGKTKLQHLEYRRCNVLGGAAGASEFLSHLQQLHQLTHLTVAGTLRCAAANPPAAAYSALTASSKLQHLSICNNVLPVGAWQHMFPAGRQLPHLQSIDISYIMQQSDFSYAPAPEFGPLVSCCPSLQCLDMRHRPYNAALLAPLQGLTGLHTLCVGGGDKGAADDVKAWCQLTGLRELSVSCPVDIQEEQLLQLTELKQLTTLNYCGRLRRAPHGVSLASKAPGDKPVWGQLLQLIEQGEPEAAKQAAAALAGSK